MTRPLHHYYCVPNGFVLYHSFGLAIRPGLGTKRPTMNKDTLIAAMREAGMRVTPDTVLEVITKLVFAYGTKAEATRSKALHAARQLYAEIAEITPPEPHKRTPRKRKRVWKKATKQPLSNAAQGSLHDKVRAPHRPGGQIKRHPVWSLDEAPLGGWDLGTHVIERVDVAAMESKLDALLSQPDEEPASADEAKLDALLAMTDEEAVADLDARLDAVLAWEPKPVSKRRKKRQPIMPPKPQQPVVLCRRVLPWVKARPALTKRPFICSRPV